MVGHDGDNYRSGIMRRFLKFTPTTTSAANGSQAVSSQGQAPALQGDNSLPGITVLAAVSLAEAGPGRQTAVPVDAADPGHGAALGRYGTG